MAYRSSHEDAEGWLKDCGPESEPEVQHNLQRRKPHQITGTLAPLTVCTTSAMQFFQVRQIETRNDTRTMTHAGGCGSSYAETSSEPC